MEYCEYGATFVSFEGATFLSFEGAAFMSLEGATFFSLRVLLLCPFEGATFVLL